MRVPSIWSGYPDTRNTIPSIRSIYNQIVAERNENDFSPCKIHYNQKVKKVKQVPDVPTLKPVIVVNMLTLLYRDRYQQFKIPHSGAFVMIRANQPLALKDNHMFSTDYSTVMKVRGNQVSVLKDSHMFSSANDSTLLAKCLTEGGRRLVYSLLTGLTRRVKNERRSIHVYLTNFDRDDSYRILRNCLIHRKHEFKCSTLTRYNNISNMRVYSTVNNRLLFKVRDFNDLLCYI